MCRHPGRPEGVIYLALDLEAVVSHLMGEGAENQTPGLFKKQPELLTGEHLSIFLPCVKDL